MRRLLKSFTAFSVIAMLLFSFCISVGAVEETHNSQDGLVASITTKKDGYQSNEDIDLTFKVTNTNDFAVENVSLEAIIPDGLMLKRGDNTSINTVSLASGESLELTLTVVKESSVIVVPIETTNPSTEQPTETKPLSTENTTTVQTESVQATTTKVNSAVSNASDSNNTNGSDNSSIKTGNNTNYILIGLICLISLAVAVLAFKFRNKAVKYLSLVLCICISVSSVAFVSITNTKAQEIIQQMSFEVSKTITVEGREYEISANVKYKNSHASPNIDFGYLRCEPSTCNVGERTNVTFFIDLSNNDISKDDKIKLFVEEKFIGELNDNGENGDVTPNDKIYSATFSMFSNERKWAGYYVVINNQKSNTESLQFYKRATDEDLLFIDKFNKDIDNIKMNYAIHKSDEEKAILEIQQCYREVTSYLDKRSDVLDYCFTGFNIMVNFDNGLTAGITFNDLIVDNDSKVMSMQSINNSAVGNNNNTYKSKIVTLEPFTNELGSPEFDNAANTIAKTNKNYVFSENLDDQQVTFDTMKNLSKYGIIILNGHGGNFEGNKYGDRYGYVIGLPEKVTSEKNEKYRNSDDLFVNIIPCGEHYAITEKFFNTYYGSNDFDNCLIYLGTCYSGDDNVGIRKILEDKGAEAIISYKNCVTTKYQPKMVATIFEQLSKGKTIEDAVSKAKEKHGNFDPYLTTEQVNNLGIFEQAWYYLGLYNINDIITPAEIVLNGNNTSFKLITLEQIKGQVIDSNTKLPVSGVKISCDKIGVSCTTDEMGKFSFNIPVSDTQYEFVFSCNGYYNTTVVLSNYTELDTIELTPKKGSISANIISSNNTPLSKVRVDAYLKEEADLEYVGNTYTDDNGNFTMELQSGSYELRFNKDGYKTATTTVKISKDVMTVLKDPIVMETNVDWKQLYIDYINKTNSAYDYSLIYLNNDDIPELCLTGKYTMAGDILCWINDGSVQEETALGNYGTSYIEKEGLLLNTGGRQGTYFDKVFSFNGKNLELKIDGKSLEVLDDNSTYDFIYYINGDKVTKAEYNNKIDSIFDKSKSIKVSNKTYSKEEIIEIIKNM
ncbi:carboxypeptidase-like regulatory domain-containing protein [Ruminococcus sp.]|uniref:carboxypeptidase-like regulatory domain-containing protein n=1 Tax=Ruminococcus sp. TaxID=41978 RepID=UPI003522829B